VSAGVLVFVLGAAACVVAHLAILVSVIRRPHPSAATEGVPRPRPVAEIIWAVVPIIALALVLTATWGRVRDRATPKPDVMMKIAR
jgi:hypothetical protein